MKKHFIIPVFLPMQGCPFHCVFCSQVKITGISKLPGQKEVIGTIEKHLLTIPQGADVEIGFFGGSFTGLSREEQARHLEAAQPYIHKGLVRQIRVSTRPDFIDQGILDFLKPYSVKTIELGAQSFDDEVLRLSGRGHTSEQIARAARLVRKNGFALGLQLMLGLPGDTFKKTFESARRAARLKPSCVRLYPALVIRGTGLEELYRNGGYTPLSMDLAVLWTKAVTIFLEQKNIDIIRVGLHPSEGLLSESELAAGPFHPSFRELVLTEIWNDRLEKKIKQIKSRSLIIETPPDAINHAAGYQGRNKKKFLRYFERVSFKPNPDLKDREFYVRPG